MGFFDFLNKSRRTSEGDDVYEGETPPCPNCGSPLVKQYVYSELYCSDCHYGLEYEDDDDEGELLSVDDAALIWLSNGMDEDYTFGYTESELRSSLE